MYPTFQQGQPAITPGMTLYFFNKNQMDVAVVTVTNVSQPHVSKAAQSNPAAIFNGFVVDVSFSVGGETVSVEFPTGSMFANYPDKGIFLSTDASAIDREIDVLENSAKQYMSQYPAQQKLLELCGPLRNKLHPERQQEAAKQEKIEALENKMDQLMNLIASMSSGKGSVQSNNNNSNKR